MGQAVKSSSLLLARLCIAFEIRLPHKLALCGAIVALGFGLLLGTACGAKQQDVDWVTNINDTGFDPTPAGGLVTYQITVTNNCFDAAPGKSPLFPGASG